MSLNPIRWEPEESFDVHDDETRAPEVEAFWRDADTGGRREDDPSWRVNDTVTRMHSDTEDEDSNDQDDSQVMYSAVRLSTLNSDSTWAKVHTAPDHSVDERSSTPQLAPPLPPTRAQTQAPLSAQQGPSAVELSLNTFFDLEQFDDAPEVPNPAQPSAIAVILNNDAPVEVVSVQQDASVNTTASTIAERLRRQNIALTEHAILEEYFESTPREYHGL